MKIIPTSSRLLTLFIILLILAGSGLPAQAGINQPHTPAAAAGAQTPPAGPVVARVYFPDRAALDQLSAFLDIWEVNHTEGYLVAPLSPGQYAGLEQGNYRLEIDPDKTALLGQVNEPLPGQIAGIPGYACYRTVEETETSLDQMVANYPDLVEKYDIGNSWEKVQTFGLPGYDIWALKLTNQAIPGPKPRFFLMAEIHARELVTAEAATRFAEDLLAKYGLDPEATWLLDYTEIYIAPMTNPDGRKMAEAGNSWRKNTDSDDGCDDPDDWGTDLNRNHSFKWDMGGSSDYPCDDTYHGPGAGSEPETQAVQDFVVSLFPDQRGPNDVDPAPLDATGTFVTLHSYSELVLWPWGWSSAPSPNHTQLQTLGRKMAYFNGYWPQQSHDLYQTSGTSDEWAYGVLGIASYTFEMGTSFFQDCATFEDTIYPDNLEAFYYAAKTARRPYQTPAGPDSLNVTAAPNLVVAGNLVQLTATVNDTRFSTINGPEPSQAIAAAVYSIDAPTWITSTLTYPMTAVDGSFDETIEDVVVTVDTTGMSTGRHTLFVQGQDALGNQGALGAVFLDVIDPNVSPHLEGTVRAGATGEPLAAAITAGDFFTNSDPDSGFYSMYIISGTYDLIASAPGYVPVKLSGFQANDYEDITQDFDLYQACTVLTDDVENGVQDWSADAPWGLTTARYHSPTHSWADSPSGNYANNVSASLTSPVYDLTGFSGATLSFWHRYTTESNTDYGYIEISTDGGATWSAPLAAYSGYHSIWSQVTLPLSGLDNQAQARFRFHFVSDDVRVYDGWFIDDIQFTGGGPQCLPPTADFSQDGPAYLGHPIQFTDLSQGHTALSYAWDFGDGVGVSTSPSPTYTYGAPGAYTATLTVTNLGGSDSASQPVTILPYFVVTPTEAAASGQPGDTVTYTLQVTNTGLVSDTFSLALSGDEWDTQAPTTTGVLAAGDGATVAVQVTIPDDASPGQADTALLAVASTGQPTQPPMTVTLTTTANPVYGLAVSADMSTQSALVGEVVTYTLQVTNTGNTTDTIEVIFTGDWDSAVSAPGGPLASGDDLTLGSGESLVLTVAVTIPADAVLGASDLLAFSFTSAGDPAQSVDLTLTTQAIGTNWLYLPLVLR